MTKKKEIKKEIKPRAKSLAIETIFSTADAAEKAVKTAKREKYVITGTLPVLDDHIRCIVLIPFAGNNGELYVDDVVDLPTRRYKSLSFRGYVKEYEGPRIPNKMR